tara:strand:+ start:437 stop:769 length:333 start_codon:yes stop_codon:yes gene_type:complete
MDWSDIAVRASVADILLTWIAHAQCCRACKTVFRQSEIACNQELGHVVRTKINLREYYRLTMVRQALRFRAPGNPGHAPAFQASQRFAPNKMTKAASDGFPTGISYDARN